MRQQIRRTPGPAPGAPDPTARAADPAGPGRRLRPLRPLRARCHRPPGRPPGLRPSIVARSRPPGPRPRPPWGRAPAPSQRPQEGDQRLAIGPRQTDEPLASASRLAAVPEDGLGEAPGPAVVQQGVVFVHRREPAPDPTAGVCATRCRWLRSPAGRPRASGPMSCSNRSENGRMVWFDSSGMSGGRRWAAPACGKRRTQVWRTPACPPAPGNRRRSGARAPPGWIAYATTETRKLSRSCGPSFPRGARSAHSCSVLLQLSSGNSDEVMPMSPLNAPAVCCRRLG